MRKVYTFKEMQLEIATDYLLDYSNDYLNEDFKVNMKAKYPMFKFSFNEDRMLPEFDVHDIIQHGVIDFHNSEELKFDLFIYIGNKIRFINIFSSDDRRIVNKYYVRSENYELKPITNEPNTYDFTLSISDLALLSVRVTGSSESIALQTGKNLMKKKMYKFLNKINYTSERLQKEYVNITWQHGFNSVYGKNGANISDVCNVMRKKIEEWNKQVPSDENTEMLYHLLQIVKADKRRTYSRKLAGVEGTDAATQSVFDKQD